MRGSQVRLVAVGLGVLFIAALAFAVVSMVSSRGLLNDLPLFIEATPSPQVINYRWEVLARDEEEGTLGSEWEAGIRSPDFPQTSAVPLLVRVVQPGGTVHEHTTTYQGRDWVTVTFPQDFASASTSEVGLYQIEFEVNGLVVATDSLEIIGVTKAGMEFADYVVSFLELQFRREQATEMMFGGPIEGWGVTSRNASLARDLAAASIYSEEMRSLERELKARNPRLARKAHLCLLLAYTMRANGAESLYTALRMKDFGAVNLAYEALVATDAQQETCTPLFNQAGSYFFGP